MDSLRITAIALIVVGALALVYGGFSYAKRSSETEVGPFNFSVDKTETVNIPFWAGVGTIVVGGALLLIRRRN